MSGNEHILVFPPWFLGLRIAQIVMSIIVLGLAAYVTHYITWDSSSLAIFTVIYTWIVSAYYIVSTLAVPLLYNMWVVVALEAVSVIFWLCSMATMASDAAFWWTGDQGATDSPTFHRRITDLHTYRNVFAAAAGMAGLELVLVVLTLILFSLKLHSYRMSHAPQGEGQAYQMGTQAEKGDVQAVVAPVQQPPVEYTQQNVPPQFYAPQSVPTPQPVQTPPPQHQMQPAAVPAPVTYPQTPMQQPQPVYQQSPQT